MSDSQPECIAQLIDQLRQLPSIGIKSAQRLAYFLLERDVQKVEELARTISLARRQVRRCRLCHHYSTDDLCAICSNPARRRDQICVVERSTDVLALERGGGYRGLYHVLGGCLSPLDGMGPEQLAIESLVERTRQGVPEIILGLNTGVEGESTVLYLLKRLQGRDIRISRLASGIPLGSELQFVDERTMHRALENRVPL